MSENLPPQLQVEREPPFIDPIAAKLEKQRPVGGERIIAATDIDETWKLFFKALNQDKVQYIKNNLDGMMKMFNRYLGKNQGDETDLRSAVSTDNTEGLRSILNKLYKQATEKVWGKLQDHSIPAIAVTGRDLELVLKDEDLKINGQPHFDGIFTAVGTEFYVAQEQADGSVKYVEHPKWKQMVEKKGFTYKNVLGVCENVISGLPKKDTTDENGDAQAGKWGLTLPKRYRQENIDAWAKYDVDPQHTERPTTPRPEKYKISMYCTYESPEQAEEMRTLIEPQLQAQGFKGKVVISHDPHWGRYNIDIVAVTKLDAIKFLDEEYGEKYKTRVTYADNSENGKDALLSFGGTLVGGSTPGLREAVNDQEEVRKSALFDESIFHVYQPVDADRARIIMKGDKDEGPLSLLRSLRAYEIWTMIADRKEKGDQTIALNREELYKLAQDKGINPENI